MAQWKLRDLQYDHFHWPWGHSPLKDTYARKRTDQNHSSKYAQLFHVLPQIFVVFWHEPAGEEPSDAAVGFRWKREHPTVQEVPPVRRVLDRLKGLGNLKGISLQVGIIQSLGLGAVIDFRGE